MNPVQNKTKKTNKHESPTKQNKQKQINMKLLQNKIKTNKHESPTKQNKNK